MAYRAAARPRPPSRPWRLGMCSQEISHQCLVLSVSTGTQAGTCGRIYDTLELYNFRVATLLRCGRLERGCRQQCAAVKMAVAHTAPPLRLPYQPTASVGLLRTTIANRRSRGRDNGRALSFLLVMSASLSVAAATDSSPTALSFDVLVYGATPAGIAAAVVAANGTGLRVALLEPGPLIGGMAGPGGIGLRDVNLEAASGVSDARSVLNRWLHLNRLAYGVAAPVWQPDQRVGQANWESIVGDARYNITLAVNTGLVEGGASSPIQMVGTRIVSISTVDTMTGGAPTVWTAAVFIDASYEGEVTLAANVSWTYGREARATYNESWAGVLATTGSGGFTQFQEPVDPRYANGTLIAGVDESSPPVGSGDDRVMPYSYRLCMTQRLTGCRGPDRRATTRATTSCWCGTHCRWGESTRRVRRTRAQPPFPQSTK